MAIVTAIAAAIWVVLLLFLLLLLLPFPAAAILADVAYPLAIANAASSDSSTSSTSGSGDIIEDHNESVRMRTLIIKRENSKAVIGTAWTAEDELFLLVGLLVYGWSHLQCLQLLLPTKSVTQLRTKREKFRC
jgi:hypothetical protein